MSEFAEHLHLRLRWNSAFSFVQQLGQMTRRPSSKPPLQIPMTLLQELSSRLPQSTAASCDAFHLEIHELQQLMSKQSPKPPPKKKCGYSSTPPLVQCKCVIHKQHETTWNNYCNQYPWIMNQLVFAMAGLPFNQSYIFVQTSEDPNFNCHLWAVFKLALEARNMNRRQKKMYHDISWCIF